LAKKKRPYTRRQLARIRAEQRRQYFEERRARREDEALWKQRLAMLTEGRND
jgi:hypothetical protein